MMVHYLTDPAVASHRLLGNDWSVQKLLAEVAGSSDPPLHALIDGGALVTGMTNLEVARWGRGVVTCIQVRVIAAVVVCLSSAAATSPAKF